MLMACIVRYGAQWRKWSLRQKRLFSTNTIQNPKSCKVYSLGEIAYEDAWELQQTLLQRQLRGQGEDLIMILQHPSVYTLGKRASLTNVKFDHKNNELPLIRVDRGGEVTYHGPGQLIMYPILNLNNYKKDLHWYLRQVEEVVIRTLEEFDIPATRIEGLTGVWANNRKLAAVGTHASKWITMHGFGLNVTTDLSAFQYIIPCGIQDRLVGSMEEFIPSISINQVEQVAIRVFGDVFDCKMHPIASRTDLINYSKTNI